MTFWFDVADADRPSNMAIADAVQERRRSFTAGSMRVLGGSTAAVGSDGYSGEAQLRTHVAKIITTSRSSGSTLTVTSSPSLSGADGYTY